MQVADADAVRVMQEAITAVEPLVAKKSLTLSREFPMSRVPMRTDIVKLRQVLINLLGNAVKLTQRGSVSVAVRMIGPTVGRRSDGAQRARRRVRVYGGNPSRDFFVTSPDPDVRLQRS